MNEYLDQPHEISIETQSICNAACTFCPYPTLERIGNKMDDATIDRLIDEMATFTKPFYFCPFKVSDPLLDKRLHSILKKLNEKVPLAQTRIFTNGSALTQTKIDELNDIENLSLWISLNETQKDKYEALMGLNYNRTIRNIDALYKSAFRHPVFILRVSYSMEFVNFVRGRWPRYQPILIKKDGWLGFTEAYHKKVPDKPCYRWYELSILSTGIVALCCMDGTGAFPIGNIHENSLLEIYNSPKWRERRERNDSRKNYYPCSTCTYVFLLMIPTFTAIFNLFFPSGPTTI